MRPDRPPAPGTGLESATQEKCMQYIPHPASVIDRLLLNTRCWVKIEKKKGCWHRVGEFMAAPIGLMIKKLTKIIIVT